jgi:hypothetical protein
MPLPLLSVVYRRPAVGANFSAAATSCSLSGNIHAEKITGGGVAIRGAAAPISINAPQLLDYSSDESGDEGVNSSPKLLQRSDMNYTKIASSILPKKKAIPKRRGSILGLQPKRRSANVSSTPDGVTYCTSCLIQRTIY